MYTLHFYAATHKQELRIELKQHGKKEFPFLCLNVQAWNVLAMAH